MKCECGGNLVETKLLAYDMSAYVGAKVAPISVDGFVCDSCHGSTVDGYTINVYMAGFNAGRSAGVATRDPDLVAIAPVKGIHV